MVLENDTNVAALGEKWLGAANTVDDVCMLTLGTGVGGGIVQQGRIWHGMTGMAGELGHITGDPHGVPALVLQLTFDGPKAVEDLGGIRPQFRIANPRRQV